MKNISRNLIIILFTGLGLSGCKKLITINPPVVSINGDNVYKEDATAASVLTGIYTRMSNTELNGPLDFSSLSLFGGLLADELSLFSSNAINYKTFLDNALTPQSNIGYWTFAYQNLFFVNAAIEGLTASTSLTPAIKRQLSGEARFLRAFYYFYLTNLYGDIPLALTTDYTVNAFLPRAAQDIVYQQIVQDLTEAISLMNDYYVESNALSSTASTARLRPNKWTATALLSRVYLFMKDYENAAATATSIIDNTNLYSLEELDNTFGMVSKETIWAIQPVGAGTSSNTKEGRLFILPSTGLNVDENPVYLNKTALIDQFENGDQRKEKWINVFTAGTATYYYPYKYKIGKQDIALAEYSVVFRLAEIYLIRAEARIRTNNISDGLADLNKIRERATDLSAAIDDQLAPLPPDLDITAALSAVEHERQVELFTEWGHRWFDLKRTDRANDVLGPVKGASWQSTDQLLPIQQSDLNDNPSLKGKQNPGYN